MSRVPTIQQVFASKLLYGLHGLEMVQRVFPDAVPAAVTMCMRFLGEKADEAQVGGSLGDPSADGVLPATIMRYASGRGIRCSGMVGVSFAYLLERIKQQKPTMVRWPSDHTCWLIPCGYEPEMQRVVFADPLQGRFRAMTLTQAEGVWDDQPTDRFQRKVVLPFDRVSSATKGHKHPLNRATFKLQPFIHTTRAKAKAAEARPD